EAIVREAEVLAAQGTREIILIGQDPTRYGIDLQSKCGSVEVREYGSDAAPAASTVPYFRVSTHPLPELLRRLNDIPDLRWIRLMYLFPDRHAEAVVEAVAALPKVCKYLDMPLQH